MNKTLVNTGTDLLLTLLDFANIQKPEGLPGISLKKAAEQDIKLRSRPYIVIENKMAQGAQVDGDKPVVNGRMVRSDRYKYCLYDTLKYREALYDLKNDPGETINIAEEDSVKDIIFRQRKYLREFGHTYKDTLAIKMLKEMK